MELEIYENNDDDAKRIFFVVLQVIAKVMQGIFREFTFCTVHMHNMWSFKRNSYKNKNVKSYIKHVCFVETMQSSCFDLTRKKPTFTAAPRFWEALYFFLFALPLKLLADMNLTCLKEHAKFVHGYFITPSLTVRKNV